MNNNWVIDKKWSDKFIFEIKGIIGQQLISESPIEEDIYHNTDLMVLKLEPYRIACRIRRYNYYELYHDEFTIRSGRPDDTDTELDKIINGWGDFLFYGFSDKEESRLKSWVLLSLDKFRDKWYKTIHVNKNNTDNSSSFKAFKIQNFKDCITAISP